MIEKLPRNRLPVFVMLTLLCLGIDLWSKEVVFEKFGLRNGTDWLLDSWVRFRLFTSLNEGALWGMGQGMASVFALLSVGAFAGILYWLFVHKAAHSLWLTVALAFVSGGTLGNLYDRLAWHGIVVPGQKEPIQAVRDFLHFQFGTFDWAIFNVADMCLVTGAIMLMIQSIFMPPEDADAVEDKAARDQPAD